MKEDRQPWNRLSLLFHLSPAILPSTNVQVVYFANKQQDSHHSPLTRLGVIISYSQHLERKITLPSTSIISPYVYSEPRGETIRRLYGVPSAENFINDY